MAFTWMFDRASSMAMVFVICTTPPLVPQYTEDFARPMALPRDPMLTIFPRPCPTIILAAAMGALGLRTHVGAVREAGAKPLLLASGLFVFLVVGGYVANRVVLTLLM